MLHPAQGPSGTLLKTPQCFKLRASSLLLQSQDFKHLLEDFKHLKLQVFLVSYPLQAFNLPQASSFCSGRLLSSGLQDLKPPSRFLLNTSRPQLKTAIPQASRHDPQVLKTTPIPQASSFKTPHASGCASRSRASKSVGRSRYSRAKTYLNLKMHCHMRTKNRTEQNSRGAR
jgi:hypothetical protein